jgi:hypothetical protein
MRPSNSHGGKFRDLNYRSQASDLAFFGPPDQLHIEHSRDFVTVLPYHLPGVRAAVFSVRYQERRLFRPSGSRARKGHGAQPSKEGIRPVGAKTTLVLPNISKHLLPFGGHDVFAF